MICILAQRGRFLETILQDGARSGVPRCGANRNAGRSGPRPPGRYGLARAVAAAPVPHCREPASWVRIRKSPRWSAERGPGRPGTGGRASQARPRLKCAPVGAPSTPHRGRGSRSSRRLKAAGSLARRSLAKAGDRQSLAKRVRQEASKTRVQQRAAGTKNTALFDIVSYDYGQRFALRAAISRVGAPPLVSRASERQRAKTRDLGATQQNRATVETSRRVSPRSRVSLRSPGTRDRSTGPRGTLSVADR